MTATLTAPAPTVHAAPAWTAAAMDAAMDRDHEEMRFDAIADAMAELEAGRLDRAESALRRVL